MNILKEMFNDNTRKDISSIFESVISQNIINKVLSCNNYLCEKPSKNTVTNDYIFHEDAVVTIPMAFKNLVISYVVIHEFDESMAYFTELGTACE